RAGKQPCGTAIFNRSLSFGSILRGNRLLQQRSHHRSCKEAVGSPRERGLTDGCVRDRRLRTIGNRDRSRRPRVRKSERWRDFVALLPNAELGAAQPCNLLGSCVSVDRQHRVVSKIVAPVKKLYVGFGNLHEALGRATPPVPKWMSAVNRGKRPVRDRHRLAFLFLESGDARGLQQLQFLLLEGRRHYQTLDQV